MLGPRPGGPAQDGAPAPTPAGQVAYRIRDVLLMIAIAGFISLLLNPLVAVLQRWGIRRRGWAVALVIIWTVAVFTVLLVAFGYPLTHGLTHFSRRLPSYVQAAGHGRGWIGHLVTRFHLTAWLNHNAPELQSLGSTLARPALSVGKGAASLLAILATIFALIVLFLLEAPKMRQAVLRLLPPERAAYCTRVAREIGQSATGYALGNPVRVRPLDLRGHRHRGRVPDLPADRKPCAEPGDHEPHGQRQPAPRPALSPDRDLDW